jgi:hypothetical protein
VPYELEKYGCVALLAQAVYQKPAQAGLHAPAIHTRLLLLLLQVPVPSVRRLLHLALQQLLRGLRPPLRLACLQALLRGAHPEEAALLLQCVQQLVEGLMQAPGSSSPGGHFLPLVSRRKLHCAACHGVQGAILQAGMGGV